MLNSMSYILTPRVHVQAYRHSSSNPTTTYFQVTLHQLLIKMGVSCTTEYVCPQTHFAIDLAAWFDNPQGGPQLKVLAVIQPHFPGIMMSQSYPGST